jgi:hypothetical protein
MRTTARASSAVPARCISGAADRALFAQADWRIPRRWSATRQTLTSPQNRRQGVRRPPDRDRALAEAHRVLNVAGRLLVLDTDWYSLVWHAADRGRMHRIIRAWKERFSDPHLPTTLQRRLQAAGFDVDAVEVVPALNAHFDAKPTAHVTSRSLATSSPATASHATTSQRGPTTYENARGSLSTS